MSTENHDFFPGFESHMIDTEGASIFCRKGGSGPALALLHGYPETHVMWHRVAPALAEHFTLVIPDLRGYGGSSCPVNDTENYIYSKRAMGRDVLEVMEAFGFDQFRIAGHDRGGRVAYRMAIDVPEHIVRIAVLDIIPTYHMWIGISRESALKTYHWQFLAQPEPLPEKLIAAAPGYYLEHTIASWTKAKDLSAFDPRAIAAYRESFSRPSYVNAACNDYRAGATYDFLTDSADMDEGMRIKAPLLALWGSAGIPADESESPLVLWNQWAENAEGGAVDSGHFVCEENPEATLDMLLPFLKR
ncbi:MAG: alpha/beta hydrolase [Hyphomicrobiales bacterium]|nr:alpha/beta hydrolase [Hyphomicrobiales bacterium]